MHVAIAHDRCLLFNCDAVELPLPENSVDAIVTDPPSGIGFMGRDWDSDRGGRDAWIAWLAQTLTPAFRALKPGGHALVWALPRTSHWTATALENLGFEIRDVHIHLFASGMPKSLDLAREVDMHLCEQPGRHYDKNLPAPAKRRDSDHLCPPHHRRLESHGMRTALKPAAEHWILCRKPLEGTHAENVLAYGTGGLCVEECRLESDDELVRPPIPQPRTEPGGFGLGAGVQEEPGGRWPPHVSFDEEAAVELGEERARYFFVAKPSRREKEAGLEHLPQRTAGEATDREEGSAGLDNPRAGAGRTGGMKREKLEAEITWEGGVQRVALLVDTATSPPRVTAASGAPSSIVSAWNTMLFGSERTALSLRVTTFTTGTKTSSITGSKILKWYRASNTSGITADASDSETSGSSPAEDAECFSLSRTITSEQTESLLGVSRAPSQCSLRVIGRGEKVAEGIRNHHCTVKSIALMRWLVRLITPPGGTVLDPFAGSGTTGVAALAEGASFVGCEQNPEYIPITQGRLEHALKGGTE